MAPTDDTHELLAGLSAMIGTIMEDEVTDALVAFPKGARERMRLFSRLEAAGQDIAVLAAAGAAIVRRRP